jgi:predicted nucleotidyltransferase
MISEWRSYAKKIARAARESLGPSAEVYMFGSAARGEAVAASDIDILVVVDRPLASVIERNKIRMTIEDAANLPDVHPFETHIVDGDESKIYFKHIGSSILKM